MYFDEDLLLDLRLNILDEHVKKFVITELPLHNGKEKKVKFDFNNFKKFKDKIIYIVVDSSLKISRKFIILIMSKLKIKKF